MMIDTAKPDQKHCTMNSSIPTPAKRPRSVIWMCIGAALAMVGLIGGGIGMAIGVTGSHRVLERSGNGDPGALSKNIETTLLSTTIGLVACGIGVLIFVVALILYITGRNKRMQVVSMVNGAD